MTYREDLQPQKVTQSHLGYRPASPLLASTIMEDCNDKFMGICGVCGHAVFLKGADDNPRGRYGNKCDRHHLVFCVACCSTSVGPLPCRDCAREAAKGSSDPASTSVGRYTLRTLESDIGMRFSYINYGGAAEEDNKHDNLIRQIQLMGPCEGVSNLSSNTTR
jgi:hypothetical protein